MLITQRRHWWNFLNESPERIPVEGLQLVEGFRVDDHTPDEVVMLEKAREYGAQAVFFEARRNGKSAVAQAFVFLSDGPESDLEFAEIHKKMWSWGGVPLIYRKLPGHLQLFRCAHGPDFVSSSTGELVCNPVRTLSLASAVASDPWWNGEQLQNGTLWDDTKACKVLLSAGKSAHKQLIDAVREISDDLNDEGILLKHLRRKLLILSLLIAYLEQREVFKEGYFARFLPGAKKFFQVLADGASLVALLEDLEARFNGNVFTLASADRDRLKNSQQLLRFSRLIEGRTESNGQLTMWELYSFRDLPVELISHIYQLFVTDADSSVYTPPFLVRLMLEETLSWERLDRLHARGEVILDPSCGSGVFLVESYKRLVLHWRSRNQWQKPGVAVLKNLLKYVHGVDREEGAVELAAFSLCLALCDALEPEAIRATIKLFPLLAGRTLHLSCFFDAKEQNIITAPIGVVVGNPPFTSQLTTPGAKRSYERYGKAGHVLPDKQLAYLFLHEAMSMIVEGGVLSMLQQYNFLYNQKALQFRRNFIATWDVREILDFISVRGLFQKGKADTKIIVIVAEASPALPNRQILHATFRRSGRSDAEQGFDIDYYDMHWIPRDLALTNDAVWRTNLLGGGRMLGLVDRLKNYRTLAEYATEMGWDFGEGFIEAQNGNRIPAPHISGQKYLPSNALMMDGPTRNKITTHPEGKLYKTAYTEARFSPPMLLIREQMDLAHCLWTESYLTYSQQIVGFCAPSQDSAELHKLDRWMSDNRRFHQAHLALISPRLFVQKATALQADDVFSILYPENENLDLSPNEMILADDVVDYYRDLVRLGEGSLAMKQVESHAIAAFNETLVRQINAVYKNKPLHALPAMAWPGIICQPFCFGSGAVDWEGAEGLKQKLDVLLRDEYGVVQVTRIARVYDGNFIFLLKPDRLRFWLRSVALRDADETLADLRSQGY